MDKKEIHSYVNEKGPNICQICVRKNGEEVFSEEWIDAMTSPRVVESNAFNHADQPQFTAENFQPRIREIPI